MSGTDTRSAWLVDIPLVKRITERGVVLDSELYFTRNGEGPQSALFSSLFQRQRGLYTMIARGENQQVVGQFRLKNQHAHAVYIAPPLEEDGDDTLWLHCLDAMAAEAGKRGAHTLIAEIDENSRLFKTLRTASFAIYARQEIWHHAAGDYTLPFDVEPALLDEAEDDDGHEIMLLYSNIVPRLIQQIAGMPGNGNGLVYRRDGRVEGYIAVAEGKNGIYLMPHLHPDVFSEATAILAGAIALMKRASKVPIFMCVRRYQDWLEEALTELGFDICARQAFMVRHIAAGVRHAAFEPLAKKLEAMPVRPPTTQTEPIIENSVLE